MWKCEWHKFWNFISIFKTILCCFHFGMHISIFCCRPLNAYHMLQLKNKPKYIKVQCWMKILLSFCFLFFSVACNKNWYAIYILVLAAYSSLNLASMWTLVAMRKRYPKMLQVIWFNFIIWQWKFIVFPRNFFKIFQSDENIINT